MRSVLAAVLCACAVALAAGCGGSSGNASTAGGTTAAPAPAPTTAEGALSRHLPPEDAVAGLRPGTLRFLTSAGALVDALYQAGDPGRAAALRRLRDGGYAEGLLRDQAGEDPARAVALVRSYVIRMRDEDAARREVDDAIDEVRGSPLGKATEVDVPGVAGGRALRVDVSQGDVSASVVFVTFPAGAYVHGIQAVARSGADLPQDEVIRAAQDLAARVS